MKRLLIKLYVLLLLGAILNMAVAWACAQYSKDFGVSYHYFASAMFKPDPYQPNRFVPNPGYRPASFVSAGWPVRSTSGKLFAREPIWPGFALNTIFYAAILWLLFAAPLALRRRRRIKRGLCPACAYDLRGSLGGSQNCPECGKPHPSRRAGYG